MEIRLPAGRNKGKIESKEKKRNKKQK